MMQASSTITPAMCEGLWFRVNEIRRHYAEWEKTVAQLESELPVYPQPSLFSNWLPFPGTRPNLPCPWAQDEEQDVLNRSEVLIEHYGEFCTPRLVIDARIHKDELQLDLSKLDSNKSKVKHKRTICKRHRQKSFSERKDRVQRQRSFSERTVRSNTAESLLDTRIKDDQYRQLQIDRKRALKNGFIRKFPSTPVSTYTDRSSTRSSVHSQHSQHDSISTASLQRFYAHLPPLNYGRWSGRSESGSSRSSVFEEKVNVMDGLG